MKEIKRTDKSGNYYHKENSFSYKDIGFTYYDVCHFEVKRIETKFYMQSAQKL